MPNADTPLGQSHNATLFRAALQIYAPTDAFVDKLLADVGAKRSLFTLDAALARKWVLSSMSREKCEDGVADGEKRVRMLNQMRTFTCQGQFSENNFCHTLHI